MGLFSGIVDAIFGGGSDPAPVTQTATQTTTVEANVDVKNDILVDTQKIAEVLEAFGLKVNEMSAQTQELIKGLAQQNAIDIIAQLQFNELVKLRTKQAGMMAAGIFFIWLFTRKKGRSRR